MLLLLTLTLRGNITISPIVLPPTVITPPIINIKNDYFIEGVGSISYRNNQSIGTELINDDDQILTIIKIFLRTQRINN